MASFDDPSWPRRPAWPPAGGAGEFDDGLHDELYGAPPRRRGSDGDGPRPKRRNILWRWRRLFFLAALLVMAVFAGGIAMIAQSELPDIEDLRQSSFICTAEVTEAQSCTSQSAMARLSSDENRVNMRLQDVDQDLVEAVIAAEDRNFYEHTGIDPIGIARALYTDVRAGGLSQGGSTITQQFVKNTFLTHDQTLQRKLDEALLAIRVEQEMSKDQILEGYLNTIYMGRNAYGVQAAAQAYFGANASELSLEQASYLAGLIRAPELADAERNPEEAERRRRTVLDAMLEEGYITEEQYTWADAVPFSPPGYPVPRAEFRQSTTLWAEGDSKGMQYVNSYVKGEASRILQQDHGYTQEEAERAIANGGLRVYTTIDRNLQSAAYDAVYNTLNEERDPSGALVALNNTGQVVAMVGNRAGGDQSANFAVSGYGSGGRPVGSTFKPIALADAIVNNYSLLGSALPAPGTATIPSIPGCEAWEVSNYDEEDAPAGTFNLVEATRFSSNTAYGHLMAELTPDSVKDMAESLGMDSELSDCLPTVLGADNSTPLEMAEVYSTFANRGTHKEPTIITRIERVNQGGEVEELYEWQPDESQVMAPEQADLVNHTLQQVVQGGGTGDNAYFGKPVAGKTGTTSSNRDAWFVGYTPNITASVWMGYPDADEPAFDPETDLPLIDPETGQQQLAIPPMNNDPGGRQVHGMASVTGGSLPAEIWRNFMQVATGENADAFVEPAPEALREGTRVGGDGGYDSGEGGGTSVTTAPGQGGPQPSDPTQTSVTRPGQTTSTTAATSTTTPETSTSSTPVTIWPPSTGPPGGGGGNPG
jgi:membrane peptidoglycan carboxypeptidase